MQSFSGSKKKGMNKIKTSRLRSKSNVAGSKSSYDSSLSRTIFLLFIVWRLLDFSVIYLAPFFISYLGFFPYKEVLLDFNLPHWLNSLANFDGIHYLLIALQGYSQWEQAFFPLYPLLIKLLTFVINNGLIVGLLISNVAFLIGLFIFSRLIDKKHVFWFLAFIFVFPTSFFFGAIYTEGLFFLLFVSTLYFLKKQKYLLTSLVVILASLTRLVGVFLIIPIFFHWIKKRSFSARWRIRMTWGGLATIAAPLVGLGIYCIYLFKTTGDPFFFLTSQPIFGANRSTSLIFLPQVVWRYIKIFITAAHNFQYFISILEFSIFMMVFTVVILSLAKNLAKRKYGLRPRSFGLRPQDDMRLGLDLFSLANILLPTLTGTFSSVPRYALFSLSFFLYLAEIGNIWAKMIIALVFLILHVVLLGLFSQGYFIS